jgi:ABC-type histidine transport system ATPase subunit
MRRTVIVRTLINEPRLLIAFTSDLDVETTAEIMRLFSRIAREGTAVLIVTHELDTLNICMQLQFRNFCYIEFRLCPCRLRHHRRGQLRRTGRPRHRGIRREKLEGPRQRGVYRYEVKHGILTAI